VGVVGFDVEVDGGGLGPETGGRVQVVRAKVVGKGGDGFYGIATEFLDQRPNNYVQPFVRSGKRM
jgi:hypothetical protein